MNKYDDIINYDFDIKIIEDLLKEAQNMSAAENKVIKLYELQFRKWEILLDCDSQKNWYKYELLLAKLLTSRNYLILKIAKLNISEKYDEDAIKEYKNYDDSLKINTMLAIKLCLLINKLKKSNKILGEYRNIDFYKRFVNCSECCMNCNCHNCKENNCDIYKDDKFISLCEVNVENNKQLCLKIS